MPMRKKAPTTPSFRTSHSRRTLSFYRSGDAAARALAPEQSTSFRMLTDQCSPRRPGATRSFPFPASL